MWKITSAKAWLRLNRSIDVFMAYCSEGLKAVRRILREIETFRLPQRSAKQSTYQLNIESLEDRVVPSVVTIAQIQNGSEDGYDGIFRVSRNDTADSLTVTYAVDSSSTAISGTDFSTL